MDDREDEPGEGGYAEGAARNASWVDGAAELAAAGVIRVGDLLSTASRAVGARFASFAAIALLVLSPGMIASVIAQEWVQAEIWAIEQGLGDYAAAQQAMVVALLATFGAVLVQTVLQFFAQAAIMYGTVEFMAGRRAGVAKSLGAGLSHAWVIIALAVLNTLAIGFGLLFCIIPGVILTCVLFASVPAAVVERTGPIEAMQRSAELTDGHRMTIFLAALLVGVVFFAFSFVVGCGLGAAGGTSPSPDALPLRLVGYGVDWVVGTLLGMFQSALAAVFYARARGIHDGVDADAIAKVFE